MKQITKNRFEKDVAQQINDYKVKDKTKFALEKVLDVSIPENTVIKMKYYDYVELDDELNKLSKFFFGDSRKIAFHFGRRFPYIIHNNGCSDRACLDYYTRKDFFFLLLVKQYLFDYHEKMRIIAYFIDVDWFIETATKTNSCQEDIPISTMCANFLYWL